MTGRGEVSSGAKAGPQATFLYAVGGHQASPVLDDAPSEGYEARYDRGVIVGIDLSRPSMARLVEYETPPQFRPDDEASILFKSASLDGELLYVPTQTEVLIYRRPTFALVGHISLPMFNDLHHVRAAPTGGLVVANTGLDTVVQVTLDGAIGGEWNATDRDTWSRFDRATDYRKMRSTKPHLAHPNFVFYIDDELWVTRFEQRDAISLSPRGRTMSIGGERVHDGVVHGDEIYFTSVDGKVVVIDKNDLRHKRTVDLQGFYPKGALLGWTRGIAIDGDGFWVSFTRMRYTRFRENVEWARRGFKQALPTRVAYFDIARQRLGPTFNLEQAGINAVFSVLVAPSGENPPLVDPIAT
jgi:hypothetical protein